MHGKMSYMENYFDKRVNPQLLVEGAQSIITLVYNYYPAEVRMDNGIKISKYAYGTDYHTVIKEKLHEFLYRLQEIFGGIHGRGFVDSAPVLERTWARKTGLGWIGKNGNLIIKGKGSFFFIATIITDLKLIDESIEMKDYCGSCTACIDACPTDAILPSKIIDGSKCISYYTIELKDEIISSDKDFKEWAFGCDICQDVCPWNRFSTPTKEEQFQPIKELMEFNIDEWLSLEEKVFQSLFKNSPIKRTKLSGIKRNILYLHDKKI
jgi:epoxyqueuosine reductase